MRKIQHYLWHKKRDALIHSHSRTLKIQNFESEIDPLKYGTVWVWKKLISPKVNLQNIFRHNGMSNVSGYPLTWTFKALNELNLEQKCM